jgi:hypothetical protein
VTNQEITEPINLEKQDIIFKFKHQKSPEIDGITAEILEKVGPPLWRCIHSLNKNMWKKDNIQAEWHMGIVCPVHKQADRNKCENYR